MLCARPTPPHRRNKSNHQRMPAGNERHLTRHEVLDDFAGARNRISPKRTGACGYEWHHCPANPSSSVVDAVILQGSRSHRSGHKSCHKNHDQRSQSKFPSGWTGPIVGRVTRAASKNVYESDVLPDYGGRGRCREARQIRTHKKVRNRRGDAPG